MKTGARFEVAAETKDSIGKLERAQRLQKVFIKLLKRQAVPAIVEGEKSNERLVSATKKGNFHSASWKSQSHL